MADTNEYTPPKVWTWNKPSGGTFAIAGAVECMVQHVRSQCHAEPLCVMTGGAAWKMAPSMTRPFELVDNLIFDGLLQLASLRFSLD